MVIIPKDLFRLAPLSTNGCISAAALPQPSSACPLTYLTCRAGCFPRSRSWTCIGQVNRSEVRSKCFFATVSGESLPSALNGRKDSQLEDTRGTYFRVYIRSEFVALTQHQPVPSFPSILPSAEGGFFVNFECPLCETHEERHADEHVLSPRAFVPLLASVHAATRVRITLLLGGWTDEWNRARTAQSE